MDADGGALPAGDRDQADAGQLRQFRHESGLDDVLDLGQLHRVRSDAERQDRRVGRIDLGVDRRRRQVGGQEIAGGVDRRLHFLLGDVEADVEPEPKRDDRRAGRALRHHLAQARHLAELPLERRRHRRGHHLRARAGIEGLDLDRRIIDLGQGRERQEAEGHDADEHDRDHQETGRDRTIDENAGRVHRPAPKRPSLIAPRLRRLRRRRAAAGGALVGRSRGAGRGRAVARRRTGRGDAPMMLAAPLAGRPPLARRPAPPPPAAPAPRVAGAVDDLDRRAVAQTVDAVDHHLVAGLEARGDHRVLAVARSGDDVALGDRRIVVEEIDEIARCAELDRRVGGERRPGHGVDQKADVDELVGEQDGVRIGECRPHPDRAGGDVDLAVVGGQRPGRERVDIVAVEHRDLELGAGIEPRRNARQIVLGRREHDADRIDLGDDDDAARRRRAADSCRGRPASGLPVR